MPGGLYEAARGTQDLSSRIGGVAEAVQETGAAAGQVLSSAQSLPREANGLEGVVGHFLAGVRSI
jgi:methyl-accepting chemotaxis protein